MTHSDDITQEMVEAGKQELWNYVDDYQADPAVIVMAIYLAMEGQRERKIL